MDSLVGPTAWTAPFDSRDRYLQAVFETERSRLRTRINLAQPVFVRCEHDLFADGRAVREAYIGGLSV